MVSCDKVQKKQISRKTKTDFGCGELERQTVSVTQTPFPSTRTVLHLLSLRIKVLPSSEIYDTPAKRRTLCAAFSLLSKWERQYQLNLQLVFFLLFCCRKMCSTEGGGLEIHSRKLERFLVTSPEAF